MKQRLNQLVNDKIIIKHRYTFPHYRGKYIGRDFYMLNWAKKQTKENVSFIFDKQLTRHSRSIVNNHVSGLTYEINSIQIEGFKREYLIIGKRKLENHSVVKELHYDYLSRHEFIERFRELHTKEQDIFKKIIFCIVRAQPVEVRNRLIEERDSILESLVSSCTLFCASNYLSKDSELSPNDMFVFFSIISLIDNHLPYTKIFEIMVRVGY